MAEYRPVVIYLCWLVKVAELSAPQHGWHTTPLFIRQMTGYGRMPSQEVCVVVCVLRQRETYYNMQIKKVSCECAEMCENIFTASKCVTVALFVSLYKLQSIFCIWPPIQRPELGCGSNPPGCILQCAADFAHLLFPKIHHCQMDPAVLMHTDFPVRTQKTHRGKDIIDERVLELSICEACRKENGHKMRGLKKEVLA